MRILVLLAGLSALLGIFAAGQAQPRQRDLPPKQREAPKAPPTQLAHVLPVLALKSSSPMEVTIAFANTSSRSIKYMQGHTDTSVFLLEFLLFKDGKYVSPTITETPHVLSKERVKVLQPGESLTIPLRLRDRYERLKPGRYELRVRYNVTSGSDLKLMYGVTDFSLDQRLMYLDIE